MSAKSIITGAKGKSDPFPTDPEGGQDDASDLLLDGLLQDVGQRRDHVVASQLLAELRAEGQQPDAEDHLVLELEATLVAQNCCDATERKEKNRFIQRH